LKRGTYERRKKKSSVEQPEMRKGPKDTEKREGRGGGGRVRPVGRKLPPHAPGGVPGSQGGREVRAVQRGPVPKGPRPFR